MELPWFVVGGWTSRPCQSSAGQSSSPSRQSPPGRQGCASQSLASTCLPEQLDLGNGQCSGKKQTFLSIKHLSFPGIHTHVPNELVLGVTIFKYGHHLVWWESMRRERLLWRWADLVQIPTLQVQLWGDRQILGFSSDQWVWKWPSPSRSEDDTQQCVKCPSQYVLSKPRGYCHSEEAWKEGNTVQCLFTIRMHYPFYTHVQL